MASITLSKGPETDIKANWIGRCENFIIVHKRIG